MNLVDQRHSRKGWLAVGSQHDVICQIDSENDYILQCNSKGQRKKTPVKVFVLGKQSHIFIRLSLSVFPAPKADARVSSGTKYPPLREVLKFRGRLPFPAKQESSLWIIRLFLSFGKRLQEAKHLKYPKITYAFLFP